MKIKFIVSQEIFSAPTMLCQLFKITFVQSSHTCSKKVACVLLMLTNCWASIVSSTLILYMIGTAMETERVGLCNFRKLARYQHWKLEICISRNTILLVGQLGTERNSWIRKSTWGTGYKGKCTFSRKKIKNCHVTIIIKTVVQLEIGMYNCLRNNDIYYCGLSVYIHTCIKTKATYY